MIDKMADRDEASLHEEVSARQDRLVRDEWVGHHVLKAMRWPHKALLADVAMCGRANLRD